MSQLQYVTADAEVWPAGKSGILHSIVLTGGSDAATVALRAASGGTTYMTLRAATVQTIVWGSVGGGCQLDGLYIDVTGTAPLVTVEFSRP